MSNRSSITAGNFFSWGWGFYVAATISIIIVLVVADYKSQKLKGRLYAADFYAILQGKQTESIYDLDAEGFAHFLRGLKRDAGTSALLDISFGYSTAYHRDNNDGHGRERTKDGAKALVSRYNLDKNLFSEMQSYLEHKKFGAIIKDPRQRKELKQIFMGEKTEPVVVDLTPYSPWKLIAILWMISQLAMGITYFIGYATDRTESQCWWCFKWNSFWPYAAIPLWFPGALPLVITAGAVSVGAHIKRGFRVKKDGHLLPVRDAPELPSKFDLSVNDLSVHEGEELLRRLKIRLER